MSGQIRHVRTVRLAATSQQLVRRGAILLEDALQTATVPTSPDGRLLLIRSLDIGSVDGVASPATVALALERSIRTAECTAVSGASEGAAAARAVTFADAVEAAAELAVRVALRRDTTAWFWPLAVPGWQPTLSRDDALRRLLDAVLESPSRAAAATRLLERVREQAAIDAFLGALRPADGAGLLRKSGWGDAGVMRDESHAAPRGPDSTQADAPSLLRSPWAPAIGRWILIWGRNDARSVWLLAMSLVAEKPDRLLDRALPLRAKRLAAWVTRKLVGAARFEPVHRERHSTSFDAPAPTDRSSMQLGRKEKAREARIWFDAVPPVSAATPDDTTGGVLASDAGAASWPDTTVVPYGGLFFVCTLLERLQLGTFLSGHPTLIEHDFVARLLRELARRLRIPNDSSALAFLPTPNDADDVAIGECIMPAVWRERICPLDPWVIAPSLGGDDRTVLQDRSRRLVLAWWHGALPPAVAELIDGRRIVSGEAVTFASDLSAIVFSWITALRRWCRRNVGIGLRSLVWRQARLGQTPTHLDLFFAHGQADGRIRKAGLDLDPGWVPWLGRVVQFHYDDDDARD